MKKLLFYLLVAFISIATTSCSNDEPEASVEKLSKFMIDTWELEANPDCQYFSGSNSVLRFDGNGYGREVYENPNIGDDFQWLTNQNTIFFNFDYRYVDMPIENQDFFCGTVEKVNESVIIVHYHKLVEFVSPTDYKIDNSKNIGSQYWYRR